MKKNNSDRPDNNDKAVPYGQPYRADSSWSTRQKTSHKKPNESDRQPQQYDQQPQGYGATPTPQQQQPNMQPADSNNNKPYQPIHQPKQYTQQPQGFGMAAAQRPQQYAPQPQVYGSAPSPQPSSHQIYSEQPQVFNPAAGQRTGSSNGYGTPPQGYRGPNGSTPNGSNNGYGAPPQGYRGANGSTPNGSSNGYGVPPQGYRGPNGNGNGRNSGGGSGRNSGGNGNGKPPRKKRKKTALWVILGIVIALLIAAGAIIGHYINRYNRDVRVDQGFADGWDDIDTEGSGPASLEDIEGNSDPIIRVKQKDKNIENILLLGVDGGNMGDAGHRSDSMMIVSINKKDNTIKISSLMRDIWAYYPTRQKYDKLNAAYSYGGPGQAVNIINHNFDMDIQKFVVTDFNGLINLVDVLGGITMDISKAEASQIPGIDAGGQYELSGKQALAYARIRKIDSDFSRVERQRNVIMAMLSTMRSESPQTQVNTVNESMQYVRSNISGGELTGDLMNMVLSISSGIDQKTIPEEGMYTVNASGTWYMELDWERQVASLHEFIFG